MPVAQFDAYSSSVTSPGKRLSISASEVTHLGKPRASYMLREKTLNLISAISSQLSVLGGVVELQPFGDAPSLGRRRRSGTDAQPVPRIHCPKPRRTIGTTGYWPHPPARPHLVGKFPVVRRSVTATWLPAGQSLASQKQVSGALPPVLVVLASRLTPWLRPNGGRASFHSIWVELSSKQTTGHWGL